MLKGSEIILRWAYGMATTRFGLDGKNGVGKVAKQNNKRK